MPTVAVAQFCAGTDKDANLATMDGLLGAAGGADLVVFPEYSMHATRVLDDGLRTSAEPLDGRFASGVAALAARHGAHVLFGMNELLPDDERVANTLLLVGPDGTTLGCYRKIHLFDAFGFTESDRVRPGDTDALLTVALGGIVFGALTCYDLRFPELSRRLVDAGATALVVPAQWAPGPQKEDHWRLLTRARAVENTVYVAAAGQCAPNGAGNSLIVDPMGVPVAGLAEAPGVAVAPLHPARVEDVRARVPSLHHRRFHTTP